MSKEKAVVIKFGGSSVTNSDGVKAEYVHSFLTNLSTDITSTFARAFFVIGGGKRVREKQSLASTEEEKDNIGIQVTQEHAEQLRGLIKDFGISIASVIPTSLEMAYQIAAQNREFALALGGFKKGQTTDAAAVNYAEILQEQQYQAEIVILSNVSSIFTADPNENPKAKKIKRASIDHLIKLGILSENPNDFKPGMSVTVDPVAVGLLKQNTDIQVYFGHSDDFSSLKQYLNGQDPEDGTVISSKQKTLQMH